MATNLHPPNCSSYLAARTATASRPGLQVALAVRDPVGYCDLLGPQVYPAHTCHRKGEDR